MIKIRIVARLFCFRRSRISGGARLEEKGEQGNGERCCIIHVWDR
jgi:hypothetical protein